jgi:hypothetical protein
MLVQKLTILDHCWVCTMKFGTSLKKEDHHIIPRAYGGVDGPQVSLCDSHHTAVHEIALRLYSKRSHFELLTTDPEINKKLLYLATVAYNARIATENDPNKRQMILLTPTKEALRQLDKLKTVYGNRVSRQTLIERAIKNLYDKHFIK